MLPKHLLDKVRRGAQSAALIAALGAGAALADDPAPQAPTVQAEPAALTKEQLEVVKTTIPKLGSEDFATREKASQTLKGFGKAVVAPLQEALKEQTDPEIKSRLTSLIKTFTEPAPTQANIPDESCKRCGRG
ncbi:MAG TPA: hypothetical protein VEJ63_13255 [Planctomycetota bacterium]|nr:hypothetical protein [Planctomycetota bacterium]